MHGLEASVSLWAKTLDATAEASAAQFEEWISFAEDCAGLLCLAIWFFSDSPFTPIEKED